MLTLRGAELLARSDVVLYDGLCNPSLLRHAPGAEAICVGKHGQSRIWSQDEVIAEMLKHARRGRTVARLKGGDPAVFARTAEEVEALTAAEVPLEIVPGITAALAAGSYAGIPVTHRGLASAVALVTGHEEPGKSASALDWHALARFPGTVVIYMGVTKASVWTKELLDAGKPAETPAALIRRCSLADQQVVHCRLDEVADRLTPASRFRPPVIVILGPVTQLAASMSWLRQRPLFGQTVLVTRPAEQAAELADPLRELGARVLVQPAIEIGPPRTFERLDAAIESLGRYDTIIFCSRNGVRYFVHRLLDLGFDLRHLAGIRIAVVGKQTAAALADFRITADVVPPHFHAEALAEQLARGVAERHVLIVRASRGRDEPAKTLAGAGARVTEVVAYEHRDVESADPEIAKSMQQGKIDWVTVTSSATARNLARLFGDDMKNSKIASLSPVTSRTLRDLGYPVAAEADPYTIEALIQSLVRSQTTENA
jgi:uroporphyrinogen III methyltransferase/synthase